MARSSARSVRDCRVVDSDNRDGASEALTPLLHGDDLDDFGHALTQVLLDAVLQGHGAAGTSVAGPVEADFDDALIADVHQLDIPTIGLHRGAAQLGYALHLLLHGSGFRRLRYDSGHRHG